MYFCFQLKTNDIIIETTQAKNKVKTIALSKLSNLVYSCILPETNNTTAENIANISICLFLVSSNFSVISSLYQLTCFFNVLF
jgi:hypothetical protein